MSTGSAKILIREEPERPRDRSQSRGAFRGRPPLRGAAFADAMSPRGKGAVVPIDHRAQVEDLMADYRHSRERLATTQRDMIVSHDVDERERS